jgi:chitinase
LDIDWEYPASAGATTHFRPEDTRTYTALLVELRAQLDARGAIDHRHYTLSAALPVSPAVYGRIDLARIHPALDYLHLMAYDIHGGWESSTAPLAALSRSPRDPAGDHQVTIERVVGDYRAAGVPASKLIVGVPFYGRGWAGAAPGAQGDGLYQPASGPAPGSATPGIDDYRMLVTRQGATAFRDAASAAFWTYDPVTHVLWSFDDATAIRVKRQFAIARGLGGVMCWDLSGDDDQGTLIRALGGDDVTVRPGTP